MVVLSNLQRLSGKSLTRLTSRKILQEQPRIAAATTSVIDPCDRWFFPSLAEKKRSTSLSFQTLRSYHSTTAAASYEGDETIVDNRLRIPQRTRHKIVSAEDAASLIKDGDTVSVSGFVAQGCPELVLKTLADRYIETGHPNRLTLLFGGGPGDWDCRGLNHCGHVKEGCEPMLWRTIGGHYGQTPMVAKLALNEVVEAWTLPMGSISRMIRAQSTHSPGHITTVGLGTYVDPDLQGGAVNEKAKRSELHPKLVSKITVDGEVNLLYKALPIDVAIIRGTSADSSGNITVEQESLLADQRILATAARNSGGIVIAQVKRVVATGSMNPRAVAVPGALVDVVVVVDEKDHDKFHTMSYSERHNPAYTGEIRTPVDELKRIPLDVRKLIARRSALALRPDTIVNLGIGLPEGVASVAAEEGMFDYVTLSTEPGVFGGIPAGGHSFGPALNPAAMIEMNQMFDFYDGGGLDMTFLGAAEIGANGDINVSRISKDRLTGPGGFIDISASTKNVYFLSPMTAKGLKVHLPGDGTMKIAEEGTVKKLVNTVYEKTFSGDEAVRRGQKVFYVTERAVFKRTARHPVLELVEIAPGIDLQKDVLDQMEFQPLVSPNLKIMDSRIYRKEPMNMAGDLFGSLADRCTYHDQDHSIYIDLFGITLNSEADVVWFINSLKEIFKPYVAAKGPIDMVANYRNFNLLHGLEEFYSEEIAKLANQYYRSAKRFSTDVFSRTKLTRNLSISEPNAIYDEFDANKDGQLSIAELREGMKSKFNIVLTNRDIQKFVNDSSDVFIKRDNFKNAISDFLTFKK